MGTSAASLRTVAWGAVSSEPAGPPASMHPQSVSGFPWAVPCPGVPVVATGPPQNKGKDTYLETAALSVITALTAIVSPAGRLHLLLLSGPRGRFRESDTKAGSRARFPVSARPAPSERSRHDSICPHRLRRCSGRPTRSERGGDGVTHRIRSNEIHVSSFTSTSVGLFASPKCWTTVPGM